MKNLSPSIIAIASEFEEKIKDLNYTFRSHYEEMLNSPIDDDMSEDNIKIPIAIILKLRYQINDLYTYILKNYNEIPENKRIEIRYYSPSSDDYQEVLVFTAVYNVFALYLRSLEDYEIIEDREIVDFGNYLLDNYRIRLPNQTIN